MDAWHIWMIVAVVLLIIEIFSTGFFSAAVAIGAFLAGLAALFGLNTNMQIILFSIGTLIGFFGVRPLMMKYVHKKENTTKTNVDALQGQTGRVLIEITPAQAGRVLVNGDDWRAESVNDVVIAQGERIEVVQVDSTTLIVKPI